MNLLRAHRLLPWMVLWGVIVFPLAGMAQIAWVKDFDAALKQAAREKKFVILDISASW